MAMCVEANRHLRAAGGVAQARADHADLGVRLAKVD
jgi:hypothetical protein